MKTQRQRMHDHAMELFKQLSQADQQRVVIALEKLRQLQAGIIDTVPTVRASKPEVAAEQAVPTMAVISRTARHQPASAAHP